MEHYLLITEMIRKVADSLTKKYKKVGKELDNIMGGKILEFKGEKIYNEGKAEGRAEGRAEGKVEGKAEGKIEGKIDELVGLVYDGTLSLEVAEERAQKKYNIDKKKFREKLDSYNPADEELMQG